MTGRERRRLDPTKGVWKVLERRVDLVVSRFVYPHLLRLWNPYSGLLARRFSVAEISLSPSRWPRDLPPLRVLLLSDIHTGIFLRPEVLSDLLTSLVMLKPDLIAVAGDVVTGRSSDLDRFLDALHVLAQAPLGAWYCLGNHDYFGGDAEEVRRKLKSIGIETLRNESVSVLHGNGHFVLGGIDDLILGTPDWPELLSQHGPPHLLLAHHPDFFYAAAAHGVPLTLSGHTHGGQIRLPGRPPIVRHSRFLLDEGAYAYRGSLLVVSRGLGSVGLPWRYGADPEAILLEIVPPR
jgi:predicted MPP superfamily phosphohydrolase